MPANYNGNTTGIAGHPTVTISEPVGMDVRNSASVQTPLRRLADFLQHVATNFALTSEVTADIATHNGVTNPHSATALAAASRLVLRDANGRAAMAYPLAADDIDTQGARQLALLAETTSEALSSNGNVTPTRVRLRRHTGSNVVTLNIHATRGASGTNGEFYLPVGFRPGGTADLDEVNATVHDITGATPISKWGRVNPDGHVAFEAQANNSYRITATYLGGN